jgi:hypothetical protein
VSGCAGSGTTRTAGRPAAPRPQICSCACLLEGFVEAFVLRPPWPYLSLLIYITTYIVAFLPAETQGEEREEESEAGAAVKVE